MLMQDSRDVCLSSCYLRKGPANWFLFQPLSQPLRMKSVFFFLASSLLPLWSGCRGLWENQALSVPLGRHMGRSVTQRCQGKGGRCSLQRENGGLQKAAWVKNRPWFDLSCSINKKWHLWFPDASLSSFIYGVHIHDNTEEKFPV